jgi:hypothetical protein
LLIETNKELIHESETDFMNALEIYLKALLMNVADQSAMSHIEGNLALILIAQVMEIGDKRIVERIFDTPEQLQRMFKICMQY